MKKNVLFQLLFAGVLFLGTSCSKDNVPNDPEGTVSLNMLNEQNGKTRLGTSDVYINKANNFYTNSCLISEIGNVGGIGKEVEPRLNNLVREVAVAIGNMYQVFDAETVFDFPSGTRAIMAGAAYYRFYVVAPIAVDDVQTGAIVKYVSVYPDAQGLPEYGKSLGTVTYVGETVSMELPKNTECFWYDGVPEVFDISASDGVLRMTLNRTPTEFNGVSGTYEVYIRLGNVYTSVTVRVN